MNVGLIGTGVIGAGVGRQLLTASHKLTVHDLNPQAALNLLQLGAISADTPRGVGDASEVVLTSLPRPQQVEEVMLGELTGVFAGLRHCDTYID